MVAHLRRPPPTEFRKTVAAVWCSHLLTAQFIDSVLHGTLPPLDLHNIATTGCFKLLHRNRKAFEQISYLTFISVGLSLWGRVDQRAGMIHLPEYSLHIERDCFFPHRGKRPRAK